MRFTVFSKVKQDVKMEIYTEEIDQKTKWSLVSTRYYYVIIQTNYRWSHTGGQCSKETWQVWLSALLSLKLMHCFILFHNCVPPQKPTQMCLCSKYSVAFRVCWSQAIGEPLALPNFSVVYFSVIKESGLNKAWGSSSGAWSHVNPWLQYQCPVRSLTEGIEF